MYDKDNEARPRRVVRHIQRDEMKTKGQDKGWGIRKKTKYCNGFMFDVRYNGHLSVTSITDKRGESKYDDRSKTTPARCCSSFKDESKAFLRT